jgi:hypothetical protein
MKRSWIRLALGAMLLGFLAACGSSDGEDVGANSADIVGDDDDDTPLAPEVDDAVSRLPWQPIGTGVSYKAFAGGANVVIVYGGYTALDEWVQRWADELYRAKGAALGIGHLYAVRGPDRADYSNHEIQNSKLAAHLGMSNRAEGATSLVVIAHSSGTYVADELLRQLDRGLGGVPADTMGKIQLFNLDGGGVSDSALLHMFAHAYFVYGCDGTINRCSHNAEAMKSLGQEYASLGGAREVDADGSGCSATESGGLWCLHDTLINTKPHNPAMYDLKNDYTDFTGTRHLVTSYLDVNTSAEGAPIAAVGAEPQDVLGSDPTASDDEAAQ